MIYGERLLDVRSGRRGPVVAQCTWASWPSCARQLLTGEEDLPAGYVYLELRDPREPLRGHAPIQSAQRNPRGTVTFAGTLGQGRMT